MNNDSLLDAQLPVQRQLLSATGSAKVRLAKAAGEDVDEILFIASRAEANTGFPLDRIHRLTNDAHFIGGLKRQNFCSSQ